MAKVGKRQYHYFPYLHQGSFPVPSFKCTACGYNASIGTPPTVVSRA